MSKYHIMKIVPYIIPLLVFCFAGLFHVQAQETANFNYSVSGVVRDARTQVPLSGIRITYKDLKSSLTDEQGKYTILLPSGSVNLLVEGPRYSTRIVSVKGRSTINIDLHTDDLKSIFNPIVAPLGEISPITLTHSWSSVTENNILSTAITSDEALQGKVSGVNLVHRSGTLASGSNMYIRGINTMNAGIQPLFIIDGMPYENSIYATSLLGNYYSNPLTSIDIKDIESITVLKDGTSQYGTKGANGVVLIRTIKPSEMETRINFHYHTGFNFAPSRMPLLTADEHKLLLSDVLQSHGISGSDIMNLPFMNDQKPVLERWGYEGNVDYYRYNNETDWQNEIFTMSNNQNYYMNVFGGDNVAVYALAVGYMRQEGVIKNTDFERFNTRFNAKVNLSQKVEVNANMSFLFSNKSIVDEGPLSNRNPVFAALVKAPFMATNVINPEGRMSPVIEDVDIFNNSNPYSLVNESDRDNALFRFVGNFEGVYRMSKHLSFNALVGVNFNKEREKVYFPNRGVFFETLSAGPVNNVSQHRVDRLMSIFTEASISYNSTFNVEHEIKSRTGFRYQNNRAEDDWAKTANTGSDNFKSISYGDPLYRQIGGRISNWNWMNFFSTIDYSFRDKYFVNYTTAVDASSRFGTDAPRVLLYPSLSGAWLISAEEMMKEHTVFDLLKMRLSYGLSGNDEIGNYSGVKYYVPQSLLGNFGLVRGNLVDLNLRPEQNAKLTLGFDASVLNKRVNLSVDLYQNTVSDMVLRMPVPRETGFPFYLTNEGTMKNTGIDFTVNTRVLNRRLKWDVGFIASTYRNEVTHLGGQEYITNILGAQVLTRVDESVGVFYGHRTDGIYATQEEALADGLKIQKGALVFPFSAGDVKFVDKDGNKLIDDRDKEVIGNPNPDLFGSVFTNMKYGNWDLNIHFNYSIGNDIYNYTRNQLENMSSLNNQTKAVLNRWRADGDVTNVPKAVLNDPMGNARFSDRWIEDGSYIRLKNITLSYHLPLKWNIIRSSTFFATAENLFVLTGYKGLDPEFALSSNPLYKGIDATFVPHATTISLGVKLEL